MELLLNIYLLGAVINLIILIPFFKKLNNYLKDQIAAYANDSSKQYINESIIILGVIGVLGSVLTTLLIITLINSIDE